MNSAMEKNAKDRKTMFTGVSMPMSPASQKATPGNRAMTSKSREIKIHKSEWFRLILPRRI